tara:strand:- start:21 stop:218 length:198 start_codon:yes stop_codon:yes gene_type:complete
MSESHQRQLLKKFHISVRFENFKSLVLKGFGLVDLPVHVFPVGLSQFKFLQFASGGSCKFFKKID